MEAWSIQELTFRVGDLTSPKSKGWHGQCLERVEDLPLHTFSPWITTGRNPICQKKKASCDLPIVLVLGMRCDVRTYSEYQMIFSGGLCN